MIFFPCAQMGRWLGKVETCSSKSGDLDLHFLVPGTGKNCSQDHRPLLSAGTGGHGLVLWPGWWEGVCVIYRPWQSDSAEQEFHGHQPLGSKVVSPRTKKVIGKSQGIMQNDAWHTVGPQ